MRLPLIAAASLFVSHTLAVFADEAWNLDYHYALVGEPQVDTTFFHRPNPSSPAALVYTLSKKGVLGAINPRDGSVVWRQLLAPSGLRPNSSFLRGAEGQDVVISGYDTKVAAWSAADGRQGWQIDLPGQIRDVEVLEIPDGKQFPGVKDAVVLSSGAHSLVQRIDGASGAIKWEYQVDGSDVPYQLSASTTEVFAIFLHQTILGYIKIRVISLDPVDGHKIDEYTLSSENELSTPETIISVGANSASPIIAWTDPAYSVLKMNIVGTKSTQSFNIEKDGFSAVKAIHLHAPYHINSQAHFLVQYDTPSSHWADVFHVNLKSNKIDKAYSLPKLTGKGAFATSTSDANVYFTRITSDQITTVSSASHGILGKWPVSGFGVVAVPDEEVFPVHAATELSLKGATISAVRSAVLLSTGDWVMLRDGSAVWQRPEALTNTVSAAFVAPSTVEDLAHQLEIEAHSNVIEAYIRRATRHIGELQRLPSLLASLPQGFMRAFLGTSADGIMENDIFGFHKIIACVTNTGRVIALDSGSPDRILWSRQVVVEQADQSWAPTIRPRAGGLLSLSRGSESSVLLLNATTGEPVFGSATGDTLDASVPVDDLVKYTLQNDELHAVRGGSVNGDSRTLWSFKANPGDRIVNLVPRPVNDPVASIGKVLGDRRVLYKYLDPNLALLVTINDASATATFFVLNTVSGAILYSSQHHRVDGNAPISSTMSENWFAYSFTAESSEAMPKGHQLVVGELFESLIPDDRGPLSTSSNFSSLQMGSKPFTVVKNYQIPESISELSVTQTRQGITSRQLLAVLTDSNAIIGIPYGILDPRRPVNRDPTKDEQAEGLFRYAPVIEFDPKWYLNHQRELLGISHILTNPALLESTSIVFAYGLDIFGTRLSPSFNFDILGKGFNKFQMLATVAGLAVATVVVAPLVMRKQVDMRWKLL